MDIWGHTAISPITQIQNKGCASYSGILGKRMEKLQLNELVEAWIEGNQSEKHSPEYDRNFWASERIFEMVDNDPEEAWIAIDAIRHKTEDHKLLTLLAAGHLEDLLATHGGKFIDRFEELAKKDQDFRRLLGGVWRHDMPDRLWARVQAIKLSPKWD